MPWCEIHYRSDALQKRTGANILLPSPDTPGPWPVMFLLHGLSDDYTQWMRATSIERYVEGTPLVVVMPDGGRGFYCDALEGYRFATAIGVELPKMIERYLHVGDAWCAAGLSMGGYGAIRLALDHPERFRSATSLSGALGFGHYDGERTDMDPVFHAELQRLVGESPRGGPNDLYALFEKLPADRRPALRIDCGVDDFLIDQNREFHTFLDAQGYVHEYEEHPGAHTWDYWDRQIQPAIQFHLRSLGVDRP